MVFDESFESVTDGDDIALLDELGVVSFKEGFS